MHHSYTAHVIRDGKFWMITIDQLDLITQALTIDEIEHMARDLVAVSLDLEVEDVSVQCFLSFDDVRAELGFK